MSRFGRFFQRDASWWINGFFVLLVLFYLLVVVQYVRLGGLFDYLGVDYRVLRASAEIALTRGFGQVYDLEVQEPTQRELYERYTFGPPRVPYNTAPMYYLPAFVLLFLPLPALPPVSGFVVWVLLNAAGAALYLRRFMLATGCFNRRSLLLAMLCYPMFSNLFLGQTNVLLLVCFGEFWIALRRETPFQAGLWLGGLLLKPQLLLVLLPGLLLGRRFKALAGFAAAAAVLLVVSVLLAGISGLVDLGELFLFSAGGADETAQVAAMMNWRSLTTHLSSLLPAQLLWGGVAAGMVLTWAVALSLWWRPVDPAGVRFGLLLLGTYAATAAIAWHAHLHMALPLLLPLLFLQADRRLPRFLLDLFLVVPAAVFVATAVSLAVGLSGVAYGLVGLSAFGLNLYLLGWAARRLWGRGWEDPHEEGVWQGEAPC